MEAEDICVSTDSSGSETITSWIDSVEQELVLGSRELIAEKLDLDIIFDADIDLLSDIKLLEYQTFLINSLRKVLRTNSDIQTNTQDILKKMDWILLAAKLLSTRAGLIIFQHKATNSLSIPRSSYKFCNYNFECEFNYDKRHCGCFAQHYVHHLVYADVKALLNFIKGNSEQGGGGLDEIKKSINTISFVINHMYEELQNAAKFHLFKLNSSKSEKQEGKRRRRKHSKKLDPIALV